MATHSSVLDWRIPWTEEPGGLQPMGSQRARHDWATEQSHEVLKFIVFSAETHLSSLLSLPPPPSTPLGHHRALSWAPCLHSSFPLDVYFTHGGVCVYVTATLSISSHPLLHTRCPLFEEQLNCFPQPHQWCASVPISPHLETLVTLHLSDDSHPSGSSYILIKKCFHLVIYNILDMNPFILIYQIYSKEGEGGEMWWTEKLR